MPAVPMGPDGKPIQFPHIMSNEAIKTQYVNDPRTALANGMMQAGSSTAPVAAGGWAWADGLARALSGAAGGYIGKKQREKYDEVDKRVGEATQAAMAQQIAAPATPPSPVPSPAQAVQTSSAQPPAGQGQQAAQQAPVGGSGGDPTQALAATLAGQQTAPAAAQGAPPTGFQVPPVPMGAPGAGSTRKPASPSSGYARPRQSGLAEYKPAAKQLYYSIIVPQEGGTNPDGSFRTSPKGAIGPGQVMPGTAPEAAKLAGLPWDDKKYRTDATYNNALGEAYYAARLRRWSGDPLRAAVAYNGGDGAIIKAHRAASKAGDSRDNWYKYIPTDEGKQYYAATVERLQGGEGAPQDAGAVPLAPPEQIAVPNAGVPIAEPSRPADRPATVSPRMQLAQALLADPALGGGLALTAMQGVPEFYTKGQDQTFEANENALQSANSRDNIAYQSHMQNWQGQQNEAFAQGNRERNAAIDYNYGTQRDFINNQYQNAAAMRDRNWSVDDREDNQAHQTSMLETKGDQAIERERLKGQYTKDAKSAAFLNSPQGAKWLDQTQAAATAAYNAMGVADRIDQLSANMHTGGVENAAAAADMKKLYKANYAELTALANEMVLQKAGGSLGVAISDGDRKFFKQMVTAGPDAPAEAIANFTRRLRAVSSRNYQYNDGRLRAAAGGYTPQFTTSWQRYNREVPLYDKSGSPYSQVPSFDDWYAAVVKGKK